MALTKSGIGEKPVEYYKKGEYFYKIVDEIAGKINGWKINGDLEKTLKSIIQQYPNIEAIYVLDSNGFMITETILKAGTKIKSPARKGENLSNKPYFKVCSDLNADTFLTYSYVSSATGSICRTGTKKLIRGNMVYFLCIDFVDDI